MDFLRCLSFRSSAAKLPGWHNVELLQLPAADRQRFWLHLVRLLEDYQTGIAALPVSPQLDVAAIRELLRENCSFEQPVQPEVALDFAARSLTEYQVHTPHPRYFGLFNPAPTTMGIAADTVVAGWNPQLAAWSHSPFAAEAEAHLIRTFAAAFGLKPEDSDGVFTSGGMEANHTALLTALVSAYPHFAENGAAACPGAPVFYASAECHHSFPKAGRLCGIGGKALRLIPVDDDLRMRSDLLEAAIEEDRTAGHSPFLIVGTAGTTNAGAIDNLGECAEIAARHRLWFHVDAAWGGAAIFDPNLRGLLDGMEFADSITFDAHKWLSVPMGAGVYLTSHPDILSRTFAVQTAYMPKEAEGLGIVDPHLHSMQWSRRFIGLKVLLSLMAAGWEGYAAAIAHQTEMGNLLRQQLNQRGWQIANRTDLPVVCFADESKDAAWHSALARAVVASGEAWISTTVLGGTRTVLRACITHYNTQPADIDALVETLQRLRAVTRAAASS